ncbi:MAG TPA: prepilin-type N-terminal cleavage/methylation domain-containing protein [Burkholderiales bacterium]|nr:prepilin-type N-terminal cleavage/methylation domain-containing protein [Burkholderiales bacterium]
MESIRKQHGFTLVEIAIVLVIIGLLLGGILKGQEMITQAKIKNVIADFSGISAAYHGYVDRYKKIPGDDPCAGGVVLPGNCGTAAGRWTGAAAGNGNGIVGGAYNSTTAADESRQWWDHLRRAGFVSGVGDQQPFNALTGQIGIQTGDAAVSPGPTLGSDAAGTGGFSGLIICSANLPDKIAVAADTQMDDGVPTSGSVRGQLQAAPNPPIGKQAQASYAETGTNVYTICRAL